MSRRRSTWAGKADVTRDPAAGAVYVALRPSPVARTVEVPVTCNLDLDADGRIVGIELLGPVGTGQFADGRQWR